MGNAGVGRGLPLTRGIAGFTGNSGINPDHPGSASRLVSLVPAGHHGQGAFAQASVGGLTQSGAARVVVDGTVGMTSASSASATAVTGPGMSSQAVMPAQSGGPTVHQHVQPVKVGVADQIKRYCFRCKENGHTIAACPVVLRCDICDNTNHLAPRCPLLKMPKPVANFCGYGARV